MDLDDLLGSLDRDLNKIFAPLRETLGETKAGSTAAMRRHAASDIKRLFGASPNAAETALVGRYARGLLSAGQALGSGQPPAPAPLTAAQRDRLVEIGGHLTRMIEATSKQFDRDRTPIKDQRAFWRDFLTVDGAANRMGALGDHGLHEVRRLLSTEVTQTWGAAVAAAADVAGELVAWRTAHSHSKADECDQKAAADSGFGPGVYEPRNVPAFPSHPFCRCRLERRPRPKPKRERKPRAPRPKPAPPPPAPPAPEPEPTPAPVRAGPPGVGDAGVNQLTGQRFKVIDATGGSVNLRYPDGSTALIRADRLERADDGTLRFKTRQPAPVNPLPPQVDRVRPLAPTPPPRPAPPTTPRFAPPAPRPAPAPTGPPASTDAALTRLTKAPGAERGVMQHITAIARGKMPTAFTHAYYEHHTGRVVFGDLTTAPINKLFASRGSLSKTEVDFAYGALKTVVHEGVHGTFPAGTSATARAYHNSLYGTAGGHALEEGFTEAYARRSVDRLLKETGMLDAEPRLATGKLNEYTRVYPREEGIASTIARRVAGSNQAAQDRFVADIALRTLAQDRVGAIADAARRNLKLTDADRERLAQRLNAVLHNPKANRNDINAVFDELETAK